MCSLGLLNPIIKSAAGGDKEEGEAFFLANQGGHSLKRSEIVSISIVSIPV